MEATARDLFPIFSRCIYLNHAAVAPMSERARAAIEALMEQLATKPARAELYDELAERLREAIGRLVHADPDTIGLVRSTAHGLSLLAQGLDWKAGDNVVGARGEYPANVYPWMALKDRGVGYRQAEPMDGRITAAAVLSLVDDRTRVVALSHVAYQSGCRLDLERIGAELDRRGIIFAVDAIQSVGALQVPLGELPVDFAAAGACKWQLGPVGIGFCYCRPELLGRLRPVLVGTGTMRSRNVHAEPEYFLANTARRFEESAVSALDMTAHLAGVELLLEVGPENVERRLLGLARDLGQGLAERGYQLVEPWPRPAEEWSGIVSFRRPGSSPHEVLRELSAAGVVACVRGDAVRLSPHFTNTDEEIDRVLEILAPRGVAGEVAP